MYPITELDLQFRGVPDDRSQSRRFITPAVIQAQKENVSDRMLTTNY